MYHMDESQNQCVKWNKPNTKCQILYNFIDMKCPDEANLQREKVVAYGWRYELRMTSDGHKESFLGDENALKLDCSDSCTILWSF